MSARYENPWHDPTDRMSRSHFETDIRPVKYRGYLIYHRIKSSSGGDCYDVVKDDLCLTQRAGLNGAKKAIDDEDWKETPWWNKRTVAVYEREM